MMKVARAREILTELVEGFGLRLSGIPYEKPSDIEALSEIEDKWRNEAVFWEDTKDCGYAVDCDDVANALHSAAALIQKFDNEVRTRVLAETL